MHQKLALRAAEKKVRARVDLRLDLSGWRLGQLVCLDRSFVIPHVRGREGGHIQNS
jgi:hypothetical protein